MATENKLGHTCASLLTKQMKRLCDRANGEVTLSISRLKESWTSTCATKALFKKRSVSFNRALVSVRWPYSLVSNATQLSRCRRVTRPLYLKLPDLPCDCCENFQSLGRFSTKRIGLTALVGSWKISSGLIATR